MRIFGVLVECALDVAGWRADSDENWIAPALVTSAAVIIVALPLPANRCPARRQAPPRIGQLAEQSTTLNPCASTENWVRFAKKTSFQCLADIICSSTSENFAHREFPEKIDRHAGRFTGFLISDLYGILAQTPQAGPYTVSRAFFGERHADADVTF
jgi:hypothetical protein